MHLADSAVPVESKPRGARARVCLVHGRAVSPARMDVAQTRVVVWTNVHGVVSAALHVARNCGIPRAGALAGFGKEAEGSVQTRQCLGERMGETGRIRWGRRHTALGGLRGRSRPPGPPDPFGVPTRPPSLQPPTSARPDDLHAPPPQQRGESALHQKRQDDPSSAEVQDGEALPAKFAFILQKSYFS